MRTCMNGSSSASRGGLLPACLPVLPSLDNREHRGRITTGSGPWTGPSLLDESLKMIEIARERFEARGGEAAGCLGPAADELLVDRHEATLFQLLQMHTQVAIGHL